MPMNIKQHMQTCKDILTSSFLDEFDRVRFIGGEIFDKSIEILGVENDFYELIDICIDHLKTGKLDKICFLTNLIYDDRKFLKKTIEIFEKEGFLDKIGIDTSYDWEGRFTEETEKWWWNNIKWLNTNYPMIKVHTGMIMTQPLITGMTKEWLDNFFTILPNVQITFNELDTGAEIEYTKNTRSYKDLFPHRNDFLKFLKNLKDWGYFYLTGFVDGTDNNPWENLPAIELLFTQKDGFCILKDLSCLLKARNMTREDGYADSNVPLYSDVKRYASIKD